MSRGVARETGPINGLNTRQKKALKELVRIGFRLTASKLSEVSARRVHLEAPVVSIHPMDDLALELESLVTLEVASVHQVFTGLFSGDAILFLNYEGAVRLSSLLIEDHLRSKQMDSSMGEILTDVGNLLLSAFLGAFGDLLKVSVSVSVPVLLPEPLDHLLTSLCVKGDKMRHAVVIATSFRIREEENAGKIAIVLAASSLAHLTDAVEVWEDKRFSA